ncbi:MAG: serine hydrolase [Chloroflexota bacterium]|nr:serine hydrolase [Chloroflexota bacterium]
MKRRERGDSEKTRRWRWIGLIAALLLVGQPVSAQDEREPFVVYNGVLDTIVQNRDDVGIACFTIGSPASGVYLNADERFPLASVSKILVLAEYARRVVEGSLDPAERVSIGALDAYWLPRTDGNRHQAWLEETPTIDNAYPLFEVVRAMMYYSSNAATDYLAERFGRASFIELYARLGLRDTDYPTNWIGLFLALENHDTGTRNLDDLDAESVALESARLTRLYVDDPVWRLSERTERANQRRAFDATSDEQASYFEQYGAQGTPREIARVMAAIFSGEIVSAQVSAIMRDAMDWSMDAPENRESFNMLATKGGSLPGILTSAWFAAPRGNLSDPQPRMPTALVIFYRDMPISLYRNWLRDADQRVLEIETLRSGCGTLARGVGQGGG